MCFKRATSAFKISAREMFSRGYDVLAYIRHHCILRLIIVIMLLDVSRQNLRSYQRTHRVAYLSQKMR